MSPDRERAEEGRGDRAPCERAVERDRDQQQRERVDARAGRVLEDDRRQSE
jgi:hypothetical protein